MKYLTIDTTTGVTALALGLDERLVGEIFLHTEKPHSERLVPMIEKLLASAGWQPADLDFIGVVRGPGSFTGIRIGIATAQGMAQVLKIPVVGVCSLDVLSWAAWGRTEELVTLLDARKNEWYMARYRWLPAAEEQGGFQREVLASPQTVGIEELAAALQILPGPFLLAGDGALKAEKSLRSLLGVKLHSLPQGDILPRGVYGVQEVWLEKERQGAAWGQKTVEPFYIRMSEAEVRYRQKLHKIEEKSF